MPKLWYQSKMVWLGIITTVLGVIPVLIELANAYNVNLAAVGAAIVGILTVILRVWFTDGPVVSSAKMERIKAKNAAQTAQKPPDVK